MQEINEREPTFEKRLEILINEYSMENNSDTPDYILARYLMGCLASFNVAVNVRTRWYGIENTKT